MSRTTPASTLGKALGIAALSAIAWGTLVERQLFTIRRHSLPVLTPGSRPVRVLHFSDLHLAPWQNRKMKWMRSLAQLAPDLVINTGDAMGHTEALPMLQHTLEPFAGIPGVFVNGSNDYYGPILKNPLKYLLEPSRASTRKRDMNTEALTTFYTDSLGWTDLNNTATTLEARGNTIELFGLNDPHIHFDDTAAMDASVAALRKTEQSQKQSIATRLGVVHAPYKAALDALLAQDAEAIFAGHTHGGQVCIPGIGALTTNSDLPKHQAKGLSVWFDKQRAAFLNVSAGLGHSIYAPVRFACLPEVSLITLTAPR